MELVAIAAASLALSLVATISLSRQRPFGLVELVWLVVIWLIAVVGPIMWFAVGRERDTA